MSSKLEWLGGRYALPHDVRDGDSVVRPEVILWLELPSGILVGSTLSHANKPVSLAESLQAAMQSPAEGPPRRPSRIRVADRDTARELQAAAAGIPIVVARVPELDDTFDDLLETLEDSAAEHSYFGDGGIPPWLGDDAIERPPAMRGVGRNDPCPCGSGRKYKKCHLDADQAPRREASAIESVHEMDSRLLLTINRYAASHFGFDWFGFDPDEEDEDTLELLYPWAMWTGEVKGKRVAQEWLEQRGSHLSAEERDWFAAQFGSWLSVWEVTAVQHSKVDVRDLLTGETRIVHEELGSGMLRPRDTLLTRVIDYRGRSYCGGMHSRALPSTAAAAVIDAVREKLQLPEAVPADRLRGTEIGWFLIDMWGDAVEDEDGFTESDDE